MSKEENSIEGFNFPLVKNVSAKLIADEITPMSTEETREAIGEMFNIEYNSEPMKPGEYGHSFGNGWFIVNEEGNSVYMDNEGEYKRLYEKYIKPKQR
jgi:hypothetical protein